MLKTGRAVCRKLHRGARLMYACIRVRCFASLRTLCARLCPRAVHCAFAAGCARLMYACIRGRCFASLRTFCARLCPRAVHCAFAAGCVHLMYACIRGQGFASLRTLCARLCPRAGVLCLCRSMYLLCARLRPRSRSMYARAYAFAAAVWARRGNSPFQSKGRASRA